MEAADHRGARPISARPCSLPHLRGGAAAVAALAQCGFDAAASSSCWWEFRAAWIDEDAARVEALGEVIALAEPPSGPRPATERARRRALMLAAHYAPLWMMTLGFEAGFEAEVAAVNARRREHPSSSPGRRRGWSRLRGRRSRCSRAAAGRRLGSCWR